MIGHLSAPFRCVMFRGYSITNSYILGMEKEIIQNKINQLKYENQMVGMREDYYKKLDSQIEILEEIIRLIKNH